MKNCSHKSNDNRLDRNKGDDFREESTITRPHDNDILFGRGNAINKHVGNATLREFCSKKRENYKNAFFREQRNEIAKEILHEIHGLTPPGRFLMPFGCDMSEWVEVDKEKSIAKICQILRERPKNQAKASAYGAAVKPPNAEKVSSIVLPQSRSDQKSKSNRPKNVIRLPSLNASQNDFFTSKEKEATKSNLAATLKPYYITNRNSYEQNVLPTHITNSLRNEIGRSHYIKFVKKCNKTKHNPLSKKKLWGRRNVNNWKDSFIVSSSSAIGDFAQHSEEECLHDTYSTLPMEISMGGQHEEHRRSERFEKCDDHQVTVCLSSIGQSFTSNPIFSSKSKAIFKGILDVSVEDRVDRCVPTIVTGLCNRILELEQEKQNK